MRNGLKRLAALAALFAAACLAVAGCSPIDRLRYPDLPCPVPIEPPSGSAEGRVPFTLRNGACSTICSLSISPTFCHDWGSDWLGDHNLHPGDSATVYIPAGPYDLLIEDCTQAAFQLSG